MKTKDETSKRIKSMQGTTFGIECQKAVTMCVFKNHVKYRTKLPSFFQMCKNETVILYLKYISDLIMLHSPMACFL